MRDGVPGGPRRLGELLGEPAAVCVWYNGDLGNRSLDFFIVSIVQSVNSR